MVRFVGVENPRILMATALNWYASMVCLQPTYLGHLLSFSLTIERS